MRAKRFGTESVPIVMPKQTGNTYSVPYDRQGYGKPCRYFRYSCAWRRRL